MKKAVIIGSGIAGLASAVLLQKSGVECTLVEQQNQCGGVARSLRKDGYTWDQGQLIIEGMLPGEKAGFVVDLMGIRDQIKLIPGDRGYIFPDYSLWPREKFGGFSERLNYLAQLFPDSSKGLKKYQKLYKAVTKAAWASLKGEQAKGFWSWIWKIRAFWAILPWFGRRNQSAQKITNDLFVDKKLAACFLSLLADFEVSPSRFPGLGVPLLNEETAFDYRQPLKLPGGGFQPSYHFIQGGIITLIEAMVKQFQALGGTILTDTQALEIQHSDNQVTAVVVRSGEGKGSRSVLATDYVVADTNAKKAFEELISPSTWKPEFLTSIQGIPLMQSVFMVQVGIEGDLMEFQTGALGYYYNTYDIENGIASIMNGEFGAGDLGYVVYGPSCHSPEMAPEGHTALTIYTVAPNISKTGTWKEIKEAAAKTLIARVEKRLIPGLSKKIKTQTIITPEDFRQKLKVASHSFGGMAPTLGGKGAPHKTPLDGFWFVGAESEDGGTVTSTLYGAWRAIKQLGVL